VKRPAIARASEGSFESIYRRHAADIYRYVLALLASPADAEEVTQTTFLNAYRAIDRGEHPRKPSAWLHTIALNLCRQRFRQAARRPTEVPLSGNEVAELIPDDESPTLQDLTRALGHLPFNQRAALVMREFEGRSPGQIADSLELSVSAVETLLFRARRSLREQLEGRLTCQQAERAISLQLDGLLPRNERGPLRAHLRECEECARLARRLRAQRGAMKSLSLLPLPSSLAAASPAGTVAGAGLGAPIAGSVVAKVAAGALAAAVVGAGSYAVVLHHPHGAIEKHHARASGRAAASSRAARAAAAVTPVTRSRTDQPQRRTYGHPARDHEAELRGGRPHGTSAGSTLASSPTQPGAHGSTVLQPATRPGRRALGTPKAAKATEPGLMPRKARTPKIHAPRASTPKTKVPNATNPKRRAPKTKVPKTKVPKSKAPKEGAPEASPNKPEVQGTKQGKPSKPV
jgi:RNA polymerase sigma factor (sigma-70 family)